MSTFKINFAYTEKYKISSVPYLKRFFNEDGGREEEVYE